MAEPTSVALVAASIPSSADIARAEKFVRERFLHDGEDPAVALAPNTPRRRALDQALLELGEKAKIPSTAWRREFSLLLGLERVLSEDEPKLVDGTVLSAHQVDALSGTLTALLAEALRSTENGGNGVAAASPELLASAAIFGPDEVAPAEDLAAGEASGAIAAGTALEGEDDDDEPDDEGDEEDEDDDLGPVQRAAPDVDDEDDDELDDEDDLDPLAEEEQEPELQSDSDEEPRDWVDEDDEEETLAEQPEDPNAAKRFWFEHATGAGKTVAALGFVEASHTGGVLILTHRRNLVTSSTASCATAATPSASAVLCSWERTPLRPCNRRDLPVVRA